MNSQQALQIARTAWHAGGTARADFVVLVALCLAGIILIFAAMVTLLGGGEDALSEAGGLAFISLFFIGGAYFAAMRTGKEIREQQTAIPISGRAPWQGRADWAAGRVSSNKKAAFRQIMIFALFWNAVSWPFAIILTTAPGDDLSPWVLLLAWVFPVIGISLVWSAYQQWDLYRRFGESVFDMDPVPGVIGGRLQGVLLTGIPSTSTPDVAARLVCVRTLVTRRRSGGSTITEKNTEDIWWDEKQFSPRPRNDGTTGLAVPISFVIPPEVHPTRLDDPDDRVSWRLSVSTSGPGPRYAASFDVPVFHVENASLATGVKSSGLVDPLATLSRDHGHSTSEIEQDLSEPITPAVELIREHPFLEVNFRMARGLSIGQGATAGVLLLGSVVTAINDAFEIAALLFLGAGALGVKAIKYSRQATRIVVRDGVLLMYDGSDPSLTPFRRIDAALIERIAVESGTSNLARSMSAYNLVAHHPGGSTTVIGKYLPDRREAEWIADKVREHVWAAAESPARR